jgi:hypothetical protein
MLKVAVVAEFNAQFRQFHRYASIRISILQQMELESLPVDSDVLLVFAILNKSRIRSPNKTVGTTCKFAMNNSDACANSYGLCETNYTYKQE